MEHFGEMEIEKITQLYIFRFNWYWFQVLETVQICQLEIYGIHQVEVICWPRGGTSYGQATRTYTEYSKKSTNHRTFSKSSSLCSFYT